MFLQFIQSSVGNLVPIPYQNMRPLPKSHRNKSEKHAVNCDYSKVCLWILVLFQEYDFELLLIMQIKKASFVDDNFSVSVSKAANEVVATYTKDETGVDLVIRLPSSYPLREVSVNCTKSLGISELKQRKWLMSMVLFLSNQVHFSLL